MIDREKVISDIEQQIRWIEEIECHKFPGWLNVTNAMRDAIALLKEQEAENSKISNAYLELVGKASKQPHIVRCKKCKHRPTDPENKGLGQYLEFPDDVCPCQIGDIWYSWMPEDNWFCADGEQKQQEENT